MKGASQNSASGVLGSTNPVIQNIISIYLFSVLDCAQKEALESRCSQFFDNLGLALEVLQPSDLASITNKVKPLIEKLTHAIKTREIREANTQEEDSLLKGLMATLRGLL